MIDYGGAVDVRDGRPVLLGGRAPDGGLVFPCPPGAQSVPLSQTGRLWSYTTQAFPPKSPYAGVTDPAHFRPYHIGYVELDELIVEARLDMGADETPAIGQAMELVLNDMPLAEGGTAQVYAFRPLGDAAVGDAA